MGLRGSRLSEWVFIPLAAMAVAGCGGGGSEPREDSPTSGAPLSSTSSLSTATATGTTTTINPQAQAAVTAYFKFLAATYEAERNPPAPNANYTPGADFSRYSFDPTRYEQEQLIRSFYQKKIALRGNPPKSRILATKDNLKSKPYPLVVISDCPTVSSTWEAYNTTTGKTLVYARQTPPPPHEMTIQVIFYQGNWGVYKVSGDTSRTCVA